MLLVVIGTNSDVGQRVGPVILEVMNRAMFVTISSDPMNADI